MQAQVAELLRQGQAATAQRASDATRRPLTRSSTACARCACSTPPAARATSSTSPCSKLKDLEREAIALGLARRSASRWSSRRSGPTAVIGIEINPYAAELARRGHLDRRDPVDAQQRLRLPRATRSCARSTTSRRATPSSTWSDPDAPPGGRLARGRVHRRQPAVPGRQAAPRGPGRRLRRGAVPRLRRPRAARGGLRAYWHEKARAMVEAGETERVGLLATQGIRGGANRRGPRAHQGDRRHLPGLVGRAWVLDGRERPRQLRGLRRRLRDGAGCSTAGRSPASTRT